MKFIEIDVSLFGQIISIIISEHTAVVSIENMISLLANVGSCLSRGLSSKAHPNWDLQCGN